MKKKSLNLLKEQCRGSIKQIMKVKGLRTISLANYAAWKGLDINPSEDIHSLKIDIQDGYVNAYGYGTECNGKYRCGNIIEDATEIQYKKAYESVLEIIENQGAIPTKVKRNVLVGLSR